MKLGPWGRHRWAVLVVTFLIGCSTTSTMAASSKAPGGTTSTAELDQYGGYRDIPVAGGGTGFFRVANTGQRWIFVTPEGHAYWMRAVYGVNTSDGGKVFINALQTMYTGQSNGQSAPIPWQPFLSHAVRRLKAWGFNGLGSYTTWYGWPLKPNANAEPMPFIRDVQATLYGEQWAGLKNLFNGLDPRAIDGSSGVPRLWNVHGFPDVFDPSLTQWVTSLAEEKKTFRDKTVITKNPWLILQGVDDRDYLFGFGTIREFGGSHPHLAWIVAATAPRQDSNARIRRGSVKGVTYTNPTVHSKVAWRNFLAKKYGTIKALNQAWGSSYTTFDTDGGWPTGRGLLDEAGRGRWLGKDYFRLSDTAPAVKADLDAFLELFAERYFGAVAEGMRAYDENHLLSGPLPLSPMTWPQVLRAAGKYLDVIQVEGGWWGPEQLRRAYDLAKKPLFVWITFQAQADSPLAKTKGWGKGIDFPTQAERGQAYAAALPKLLQATGSDGVRFVVGLEWWAYTDKVTQGESFNFGLVSNLNNAYDGREAVIAPGKDPWGYRTGGEKADYGDFLSHVIRANRAVGDALLSEMKGRPTSKSLPTSSSSSSSQPRR